MYSLEEIIAGKVPTYGTLLYVNRFIGAGHISDGYKTNYLECCKEIKWCGIPICFL